ncbi:MAG: secondary thiamine-phosphate synthase enzyme YjbQ [bacterium]
MYEILTIQTKNRVEMVDITPMIQKVLDKSGVKDGLCVVYVPHTTAAVTINENADPDVQRDILQHLSSLIPVSGEYRHMEGNADAHIKASLVGSSETVIVEKGSLVLGTWQSVFFCEFDGPRTRKCHVKIIEG